MPFEFLSILSLIALKELNQTESGKIGSRKRNGDKTAVEAVEHTAVPGDNIAGILNPKPSFPLGLKQIAAHSPDTDQYTDNNAVHKIEWKPG